MRKVYNLIIVTQEPIPEGLAATNRILCYASEIAQHKRVLVISLAGPLYNSKTKYARCGSYKNFNYLYLGPKSLSYTPNKLNRAINLLVRYIKLIYLILFKFKYSSLLLVSRNLSHVIILKILSVLKSYKFYRETSEVPEYVTNKYKRKIYIECHRLFDGLILISDNMRRYYSFIPDSKIFILPVLVDQAKFNNYNKVEKENFFFYCSGGNLERDGFLDSLKAFVDFHKINEEYKLLVATSINKYDNYHKDVIKIMENHKDCITFLGKLDSSLVPQYLIKAKALLITPHHNYVTRGFPTKLSEYLISATPVICTSIDDLRYELDSQMVYMVQPNTPSEITDAMQKIVSCPTEAKKTGLKGRAFAVSKFTMKGYCSNLIQFLNL